MQHGEFLVFAACVGSEETKPPRKKTYAPRSNRGCLTCRRRRVRCDESRPQCQRCTKAHVSCLYIAAPTNTPANLRRFSAVPTLYGARDELLDLHFWVEVGAANIGAWHCPSFYEQLLPQFGAMYESARYALLAVSTCVRQWHVPEANREALLDRGSRYYSRACGELIKTGDSKASIEGALVSSLALFCFDSFTNNMNRRYLHSNAAISLLRLLKDGLTYNDVSGWRSDTGRIGSQVVAEATEAYFDDISYSLIDTHLDETMNQIETPPPGRSKLYIPVWLRLNKQSTVLPLNSSSNINEVESPSTAWTVLRVVPANIRECHAHITLWHCWLFTWLINTSIPVSKLTRTQTLCSQWHAWLFAALGPDTIELRVMQNRALILAELIEIKLLETSAESTFQEIEDKFKSILLLIKSNVDFSMCEQDLSTSFPKRYDRKYGPRRCLRGLAKVVEYVLRQSDEASTRERACKLFSLEASMSTRPRKITSATRNFCVDPIT